MVESTNDAVEEAATQAVGTCPQRPVPPPKQQQLEQVMRWIGPVCNGPPGSGGRPLSEYFLQRRQLVPNNSPSIPDVTVQTSLLVLGGAAIPDWKQEAHHAFYEGPVELYQDLTP